MRSAVKCDPDQNVIFFNVPEDFTDREFVSTKFITSV